MILVVGGIAQGKRTYVRSLGYEDAHMSPDPASGVPVLLDLQDLLRAHAAEDALLRQVAAHEVVVCCEVGQGVVPMDAADRTWRDEVGRACTSLASEASAVVRMVCGIPVPLKGRLPQARVL